MPLTCLDIPTNSCALLVKPLGQESVPLSILENVASLTAMYLDCADIFEHPLDKSTE